MRVLVTNPWNGQAYCVLRSLRGHASRVVATVYREHGVLGRLAPAAVSRFVDRVYPVPLAIQDWRRGALDEENSAAEEGYVRAVLDICERERLDTVFPTWDPEVLLLSKNKSRLAERGITVPVPEWSVLRRAMDKHALVQAATELGFPCPRTLSPRHARGRRRSRQAPGLPGRREAALLRERPRIVPRDRPGEAGGDRPAGPADLRDADAPGVDSGRARPARERGRHPGSHGPPDHGARAPASADGAEIVRLLALCSGVLHGDARGRRCHPPAASPRLRGARSSAGQGGSP